MKNTNIKKKLKNMEINEKKE